MVTLTKTLGMEVSWKGLTCPPLPCPLIAIREITFFCQVLLCLFYLNTDLTAVNWTQTETFATMNQITQVFITVIESDWHSQVCTMAIKAADSPETVASTQWLASLSARPFQLWLSVAMLFNRAAMIQKLQQQLLFLLGSKTHVPLCMRHIGSSCQFGNTFFLGESLPSSSFYEKFNLWSQILFQKLHKDSYISVFLFYTWLTLGARNRLDCSYLIVVDRRGKKKSEHRKIS